MRINWRWKALLPVFGVLLAGIAVFTWLVIFRSETRGPDVILVAAAGAVTICVVLLFVLAVLIQSPLVELQKKIARLRDGDLTVSVSFADHNDDIGDLGHNFNEMVRQLRESREQIERLHRTQMSRAEHLATLGELAAGLAHEIRNPLAGIAGVIEVISQELPAASPSRAVMGDVQREVLRIQQILNDLLSYARPKPPNFQLSNLNDTAAHAVALAKQQAISRPVEIKLVAEAALPPVEHDAVQIEQVLLNLLLNALQAIEGAGRIIVELDAEPGSAAGFASTMRAARISVSDTGRGIRADLLPKLFRPFFTTKGSSGTGLGLSLARRIVEDHGGRIDVTSTPGQGSRFEIYLPVHRIAPTTGAGIS